MVDGAYSKYIDRTGILPAPMKVDYYDLLKKNEMFIMFDPNEKLVGSMAIDYDPPTELMIVNNWVVDPTAQADGHAHRFLDCAVGLARMHGCKALILCTNFKMKKVFRRYVEMGFEEVARKTTDEYELVDYYLSLA